MDTETKQSRFDTTRTQAFAERMVEVLNSGMLATMTSIGHRTGLLDTLAELPPSTSQGVATATGLDERYVREWLSTMTVGGILEHDPDTELFSLPAEHAACLTRKASPENLAVYAQFIPLTGQVEERIIECFERGGGVAYCHYPRFHEVMAEDSDQAILSALFTHVLPLETGLPARLEAGINVLDIGCGVGHALNAMAERYPRSRFVGYDLGADTTAQASEDATRLGNANVLFDVQDIARITEEAQYDLVTGFDAIHDQRDPAGALRCVARALRPGGLFLAQDIRASSKLANNMDHPFAPFLYAISCMHCTPVSKAQGGPGLGTMWGEELALEMFADAGFDRVEVRQLEHDPMNNYYLAHRD